jgi:hypothetical protein
MGNFTANLFCAPGRALIVHDLLRDKGETWATWHQRLTVLSTSSPDTSPSTRHGRLSSARAPLVLTTDADMDDRDCELPAFHVPIGFSPSAFCLASHCPGAKPGQALDVVRQPCRRYSTCLAVLPCPYIVCGRICCPHELTWKATHHAIYLPSVGVPRHLYNSDCRAYRSRVTGRHKISTSAARSSYAVPYTASRLYSCVLQRCALLFLFEPCTGVSVLAILCVGSCLRQY